MESNETQASDKSIALELVGQVRSGKSASYAELVRRHHANILGLCVSLLGDRTAAEDAAQEVFIKAYRSLDGFRGASSFSSWLYRIASNLCLDLLRRKSREKMESLDALLEEEGGRAQSLLPMVSDPVASLENADLAKRALDCLSPEYRLILTLREVQGLNYKELAEALECSLDAVKARLKRARQSLMEMLRHILKPDSV